MSWLFDPEKLRTRHVRFYIQERVLTAMKQGSKSEWHRRIMCTDAEVDSGMGLALSIGRL